MTTIVDKNRKIRRQLFSATKRGDEREQAKFCNLGEQWPAFWAMGYEDNMIYLGMGLHECEDHPASLFSWVLSVRLIARPGRLQLSHLALPVWYEGDDTTPASEPLINLVEGFFIIPGSGQTWARYYLRIK